MKKEMIPYLTELKDKSADETSQICWCAGPMCSGCEEKTKKIFKSGFDKAHDTLMPVIDVLTNALECRCTGEADQDGLPILCDVCEALEKAARLLGQE
jgi:hypothetical protein